MLLLPRRCCWRVRSHEVLVLFFSTQRRCCDGGTPDHRASFPAGSLLFDGINMSRPAPNRLTPWIESLILSYRQEEEEGGSRGGGRMKAHVIGVSQMTLSQVRSSEGPTGLLFLSDGVLQIPAVLTASAWEHLQEQEDRECFTSLVNTTVIIQNFQLHFHMAQELTKCRFFLSVGDLATTAAGTVKDNTPSCTTLPSVRMKFCETWRALLGQEDSQKPNPNQFGLDLSEVLGEWKNDCPRVVLKDTKEKLMAARCPAGSPQQSASTSSLTSCTTDFDRDRRKYKEGKCIALNTEYRDTENKGQPANVGSSTCAAIDGDLPQVCKPPESMTPPVDDADWQSSMPANVEGVCDARESSPVPGEYSILDEVMVTGIIDWPLSNPWDMFPPPGVSPSSSDTSPQASPTALQPRSTTATSKPESAVVTSTLLPVHSSKETSSFPPYQKQPSTSPITSSSSAHVSRPASGCLPTSVRDRQDIESTVQGSYRKPKKKRCEATPQEPSTAKGEEELSQSPPSWLFDTQSGPSGTEECRDPRQTGIETVLRKTPKTHSDGRQFTYSYKVSGQNLQDFSRFRVPAALLHWAVKYLVAPKQTDILPNVIWASSCDVHLLCYSSVLTL